MKSSTLVIGAVSSFLISTSAVAQDDFGNLNFEDANPITASPGYVTSASAIPDWTAAIAGATQDQIWENGFSTGAPAISLISANYGAIDGNYSVLLTGSISSASISQTGEIPPGTQSLLFDAEPFPRGGPLVVTVGNDNLTLFPIQIGANFNVYGANITAWGGQTEQLTFTAVGNNTTFNVWEIDDISFSPTAVVPEPNPFALTAIGGLLFGLYRRFWQKR